MWSWPEKIGFLSFLNKNTLLRKEVSERIATVKVMSVSASLMSNIPGSATIMNPWRSAPHLHCRFSVSTRPQILKKNKTKTQHENVLSSVKAFLLIRLHLISKFVSKAADMLSEDRVWLSLCRYLLLGRNTWEVKQTHSQAAIITRICLKNILC